MRRELVADKASPRTIEGYEYGMSLLTDWADTPLLKLANARGDIRRRWNEIKAQIGDGAANSFVKTLRRIYRHAMTMDDALPPMGCWSAKPSARASMLARRTSTA